MKLVAYGDSFVMGDQDDFVHEVKRPTHSMGYDERTEYLRYNVSFPSLISKHFKISCINRAERGSGNYPQLDKLYFDLESGIINSGDLILFGITTVTRDRISLGNFKRVTSTDHGECLIDRKMINSYNTDKIGEIDLFYILSILQTLSKCYSVNIISFNIFDIPLSHLEIVPARFNFENYIGWNIKGNSLIDILNDTWGESKYHPYHTDLKIPQGYENYYTIKKHPSIDGHKKISNWFINNIDWKQYEIYKT